MTNPKCPVCGNPLTGRVDRKYCSDQCRYLENNKNTYDAERPIPEINSWPRKNRAILKALCRIGKATVRKEVMVAMGYDVMPKNLIETLYLELKGNFPDSPLILLCQVFYRGMIGRFCEK